VQLAAVVPVVMRHTYKSASATPLLNAVAKVAGK